MADEPGFEGAGRGLRVKLKRQRVLADLARVGVVHGHTLVSSHHVVLDPAYVHITRSSMAGHARLAGLLRERGLHSIGRYGRWTYCSIEDNLLEAEAWVARHAPSAKRFE